MNLKLARSLKLDTRPLISFQRLPSISTSLFHLGLLRDLLLEWDHYLWVVSPDLPFLCDGGISVPEAPCPDFPEGLGGTVRLLRMGVVVWPPTFFHSLDLACLFLMWQWWKFWHQTRLTPWSA